MQEYMTIKPAILFISCLLALNNTYATNKKIKKVKDPVLYVVDYIPMVAPNEFNFRLAGDFYISSDDIYSKEVISDTNKIRAVGYRDVDTLIVIITNEYHNRPEKIKQIPSFYSIVYDKYNDRFYEKNSKKLYTGDFINYYFFGKTYNKGRIVNGLLVDSVISYYEDGITKKICANLINGAYAQYFVNGALKTTGAYRNGLKSGYWVEWYSTGVMKRRLLYENDKSIPVKEDQKWTELVEKAAKYEDDIKPELAIACLETATEIRPELADAYYLKGNLEFQIKHYHDAILDFNKATQLEPLYTEAIAARIFTRITRLESPGGKRALKNEEDITPEAEKAQICSDLNILSMCQKMDRYVSVHWPLKQSARGVVLNAIEKYCQ